MAFANRDKKTRRPVWEVYEKVTPALHAQCSSSSQKVLGDVMPQIERFIVLMHDKTVFNFNDARKDLSTRKDRSLKAIPPTSTQLIQHVKRSAYQAGYQWG